MINITSTTPSDVWTANGEASYGNYNYRDTRFDVSGPLSPGETDFSLGAGYTARDGYTVNSFTGHRIDYREDEFTKPQLLFKINPQLEIRLIGFGERDHDGDYALGDLAAIRANPDQVNRDFEGFNHRDVASGTMLANYTGENVDISSITGGVWWSNHGTTDLDYTTAPGNTRDNLEQQHQVSQEFRFASAKDHPIKLNDDLDLSWQAGVFLFTQDYHQNVDNQSFANVSPTPPPVFVPVTNLTTAALYDWGTGVYEQMKLTAWKKFDFWAGVRFDYEKEKCGPDLNHNARADPQQLRIAR